GPRDSRGYLPLAFHTPDSPTRQIRMFTEHRDERRDRPRDSSARGRLSRCNIESTTRGRSWPEAVEVDRVAARRRSRADENRPGGALAAVQNFCTMSPYSFLSRAGRRTRAVSDFVRRLTSRASQPK